MKYSPEPFIFTDSDIQRICEILGTAPQAQHGEYLFTLSHDQTHQSLTLNLSNNVALGDAKTGALVIVQTQHGYFELHDCTGFLVFEPDELIFISANATHISGLVVGKQCTCSMFTNVRRSNLSADFTELDPRLLMSAMQLSIAELLLPVE
ncbi:MAG: hypothetical protein RML40_01410 [Bacteroidota bacterium]|nr:hypothetical protein [Bacteroidota bacterium]